MKGSERACEEQKRAEDKKADPIGRQRRFFFLVTHCYRPLPTVVQKRVVSVKVTEVYVKPVQKK